LLTVLKVTNFRGNPVYTNSFWNFRYSFYAYEESFFCMCGCGCWTHLLTIYYNMGKNGHLKPWV